MKLRYLFSTILASALLLVGCTPESIDSFENIKLSQTYLSIPVEGGSVAVTVTATGDWAFVEKKDEWPKCMGKDENGKDAEVDAWLTVDKMSGSAGETVVTFTAGKAESGREFELEIKAGNNTQFLRVRQGSLIAEMASCAEIIAGPDGKNYKAKGICTSIASDYYGNWYLNDGTGEVYVYGTVNADGEYDWASFGIEVGDSVYVEGPKKTYSGTIELVNVTVSKVVKALLALPKETSQIEKTAQDHTFKVAYKGKGVFVEVGDKNAQNDTSNDWITYKSMDFKKGVPSKLEPNPADTAFVTVSVAAVPDDLQKPRNGYVTVKSYLSEKESTAAVYTIKQMGHTPDVTPINTLVQQDATDKKYVRVEGIVAALSAQGLVLADETGALVVYYGGSFVENNKYKIGNKIAVQGTVGINNFGIQVAPDYDELLDTTTQMKYGDEVAYDGTKLNTMLQTLIDGGHGADRKTYYGVHTEYATMSGELIYDGSKYFNLKVEGATKQASLYNPDAALKLPDYNGKKVVVKGYVFSVSCTSSNNEPTYVCMMVTSVKEEGAEIPTIAEVRAAKKGDDVETSGVVMALHQKGYIISDETGSIYVYTNATPTVEIGNKVTLSGTFDNYYGTLQIKNATVSENDYATTVTYPTPVDLTDQLAYDAYATFGENSPTEFAYVKIKGVLSSGRYITIGTSTKQSQLDWSNGDYSALNGKTVVVTAYIKGFHSNGYYQLMETSVVEAE